MPTASRSKKRKSPPRKPPRRKAAARPRPGSPRGDKRPARKPAPKKAPAGRPASAAAAPPKPARPVKAAKPVRPTAGARPPALPAPSSAKPPAGARHGGGGGKKARKSSLLQRHPGFVPGDLLIPGGVQGADEVQYFLRGCVAAEHAAAAAGVAEILAKKGTPEAEPERSELARYAEGLAERFESGSIEPLLPSRAVSRRNFAGVVERAKHRRREIGAFLRGLDMGRTDTAHMDSHGEASLQSLMEWAARLENLAEADEPDQADYAMFHRGMDQLENTTEALILDVELTLRRLRDRVRAS